MKNVILAKPQFQNALRFIAMASKTASDKNNDDKTVAAIIFNPQEESCKLISNCCNEAQMTACLDAVIEGLDEPLWLEVEVLFLERALRNFQNCHHIKLELDLPSSQINVVGGVLHDPDMISDEYYFTQNNEHIELQPKTALLKTLSSYDFQTARSKYKEIELNHQDRKLLKLASALNKSHTINENDAITLEVDGDKLVIYSTSFYVELSSEFICEEFSATLGGASFEVFQQIVSCAQISPRKNISLGATNDQILVSTAQAYAQIPSKPLCERPALRVMPEFEQSDTVAIDVRQSLCALKEVDALQKKNEDIVRVLRKNDKEKALTFEVNSHKGHLASQIRWDSKDLDKDFNVSVLRGPLIAALMLLSDDVTAYFCGHQNESDYLYVTNLARTKYVCLEKLT